MRASDFADFDLLVAMDRDNERDLLAAAPDDAARAKVRLLRDYDPESAAAGDLDVPDPYYGGARRLRARARRGRGRLPRAAGRRARRL